MWSCICTCRAAVLWALPVALAAGAGGCSRLGEVTAPVRPPDAVRMTAEPAAAAAMPGRRISTLLDFDSPQDMAFVVADRGGALAVDDSIRRGGRASLRVSPGTPGAAFKLSTLLTGRPFPADWTLAGVHVHADRPTYLTLSYEVGGAAIVSRTVGIAAGTWTPVMMDLAALKSAAAGAAAAASSEAGTLRLSIDARHPTDVHVEDVMLIDNHESVIDTTAQGPAGWSVRRRGLYYVVDAPQRFSFGVPTAHAEQGGWSVADACAARVRFASSNSPGSMTVYADGRMFYGGEFRPLGNTIADASVIAAQHASPAEVAVPETLGRVNRSTRGDANNDGYNEARGAYQVVAAGPRVEVTIAPRTALVSRPVLEIAGLPGGPVLVHMEGRLVTGAVRLPGGDVLIELPAQIRRPTLVNVRVQ